MNISKIVFLFSLFSSGICFSKDVKPSDDRRKVEFFEKLYDRKIKGVKPFDGYQDPDTFYSEIAKQVGIPEIVYEAVEKELCWKNDDGNFLLLMIKGGGNNDAWVALVTKVPSALKDLNDNSEGAKTEEEKKKLISERIGLLKYVEIQMVVVGYDGKISFPENKK